MTIPARMSVQAKSYTSPSFMSCHGATRLRRLVFVGVGLGRADSERG